MGGQLEQWHRARPSSLQIGYSKRVWELIQKSLGAHPWSMGGQLEHWHRGRPSVLQIGYSSRLWEIFQNNLWELIHGSTVRTLA